MRCLLFFGAFLSSIELLPAQEVLVVGKIIEAGVNIPVPDVNVKEKNSNKKTVTNSNGFFTMRLNKGSATFIFSHVSFTAKTYSPELNADTITFTISMNRDLNLLDPVDITFRHKPDTVIGSQKFFIHDFEFYGDLFVLLTFDKKPEKSKVMLAGEEQKIISVFNVPVNAQELYKDFLGYINVIGKDSVYRVIIENNVIRLASLEADDFDNIIRPCIDTVNGKIVFSDYRDDYPEFNYYTWNMADSTATKFRTVVDKDLSVMYSFEYDFLQPKQKLYARKMELATGIDKREIAAAMTNFAHSRYFTPLYAPMFVLSDTMYLFEHYRNKLYRFDKTAKLLDSVNIDYHKPAKWREWRRRLVKAENSNEIYGLFLKDGYYYLKQIDVHSGKICAVNKLTYPYLNRVRVKDGYAYYVYRPFESLQTKYLYKEKIGACGGD